MAFNLHITLKELLELSYDEYIGWIRYFNRRPIGWREDTRVSTQLAAAGVKSKADKIFPSIKQLNEIEKQITTEGHKLISSPFYNKIKSRWTASIDLNGRTK